MGSFTLPGMSSFWLPWTTQPGKDYLGLHIKDWNVYPKDHRLQEHTYINLSDINWSSLMFTLQKCANELQKSYQNKTFHIFSVRLCVEHIHSCRT